MAKAEKVETTQFQWPASRILKRSIGTFIGKWWWTLAIPLAACIIAGCYDWRWLMVALMLLLVVFPGIMMLAYYSIALTPQNARAALPQQFVFHPSCITIVYSPIAEGCNTPAPVTIDLPQVKEAGCDGQVLKITTTSQVFEVPTSAFSNSNDLKQVIKWLPEAKNKLSHEDF